MYILTVSMQELVRKIHPIWFLRIGFGVMFAYSGVDLIRHPWNWYGFMPQWLVYGITRIVLMDTYLRIQGAVELAIALLLLLWFLPRWALRLGAAFASLELLLITLVVGIDLITFRDLGLLGAALALLVASFTQHETFQHS